MGALTGNPLKLLFRSVEKRLLLDQVSWRVTGQGEFGKDNDLRARSFSLTSKVQNFCGVRREIPNRVVDLRKSNTHFEPPL